MTELRSLSLSINGQNAYFNDLKNIQGQLFGYIKSLTDDPITAKDILQETNLVIYHKRHNFKQGTYFKSWCFTIARFQIMAYRSKNSRFLSIFTPIDDHTPDRASLSTELDRNIMMESIHEAIDSLPSQQREMIQQKYISGLSLKEIAKEHDMSVNNLAQILFRARKKLKRHYLNSYNEK